MVQKFIDYQKIMKDNYLLIGLNSPTHKCRVFAIRGKDSGVVLKQTMENLADISSGECWTHSIPGCGHSILTERPAYLADILQEFLDSL
jgi:pimeloyl-ACP methyl ester carboxylesterase